MSAPFARFSYQGAIPGADASTYVLFATVGPVAKARTGYLGANYFAQNGVRKFCLDLDHNQAGTLNAYKSSDEGATWRQVYTEAITAPPATGVTQREWLVEGVQDWKLEWVNGGVAQNPWVADMSFSTERANAGPPGGGFSSTSGAMKVEEQRMAVAEDNTNGVFAVHELPLGTTTYNALASDIITAANAGVIKNAPGNLYRAYFTNNNAVAQIYALVNKATMPVTTDVPTYYFRVPALSTFLLEYRYGKRFSVGISWAQVTAVAATITLATADTTVSAEYE